MKGFRQLLAISAGLTVLAGGCTATPGEGEAKTPSSITAAAAAPDPDLDPQLASDSLNEWRRERAERTLHVTETPSNDEEKEMAALREQMCRSPLGARLFDDLKCTSTTMCSDKVEPIDDDSTIAAYMYHLNTVVVRTDMPQARQILHAAHELRHGWQDEFTLLGRAPELTRENNASLLYMTEADARAFAVAVAWQLKEQGDDSVWKAAEGLGAYQPITAAFEQRMEELTKLGGPDLAASDAGLRSAMRSAFKAWFTPGIMAFYEDQAIAEAPDTVHTGGELPANVRQLLGRLPGDPVDGSRSYIGTTELQVAEYAGEQTFPYAPVPAGSVPLKSGPATGGGAAPDKKPDPAALARPEAVMPSKEQHAAPKQARRAFG